MSAPLRLLHVKIAILTRMPHESQAEALPTPPSTGSDIVRFIEAFFRDPKSVSSVWPTSRLVIDHICNKIDGSVRKVIVELGPGTGGLARALLEHGKLTPDSLLILIEKDKALADALRASIRDPRVRIYHDTAESVREILHGCDEEKADHVLLSIPLTKMAEEVCRHILQTCHELIADEGSLIAHLFKRINIKHIAEFFAHTTSEWKWQNLAPPLYVIEGKKY